MNHIQFCLFALIPFSMCAMNPNELLRCAARNTLQPRYKNLVDQARDALRTGADVNQREHGFPPLHLACMHNLPAVAQFLIDNGAFVDGLSSFSGLTPLKCAISSGFLEMVKLLLDNHAQVNLKDWLQNTPLHYSLKVGEQTSTIIGLLLERGADLYAKDSAGQTPLAIARSDHYRYPKNTQTINAFVAHPAIVSRMTVIACMNHVRLGVRTVAQNQGTILPYNVMQRINKLLHADAGLHPADY